MELLTPQEVDELLASLVPRKPEHADSLLDLRELLLTTGHPGKCVRCFFTLSEAVGDGPQEGIDRLRVWLQRNVEIQVSTGSHLLETVPFAPLPGHDLETYCRGMIRSIRMDRAYRHRAITIRFQYRNAA